MAVGYPLGSQKDIEDIDILNEDQEGVITYSKALPITLSRIDRNTYPNYSFLQSDTLTVPYSTINITKKAKEDGVKEGIYVAGGRPDQYTHVRAKLDLWGFPEFVDYLYTICELGFLEGIIPILDVGFLSPNEIRKMAEVCALIHVFIDSDQDVTQHLGKLTKAKKRDLRFKQIEWVSKLKTPVSTSILVAKGITKDQYKSNLEQIAQMHEKYGMIHNVTLHRYTNGIKTLYNKISEPTQKDVLQCIELAKSILPEDILLNTAIESAEEVPDFIKAGINDLGSLLTGVKSGKSKEAAELEAGIVTEIEKIGLRLHKRFPLKKAFIKNGQYSKKLGQVFDAYRYKIKKDAQEKLKESK
tara:strand:- start:1108 stop:2178 length:1071 start_codon:yes stop_codon:yes gene_type:complete